MLSGVGSFRSSIAGVLGAVALAAAPAPALAETPPPPGANVPCSPDAQHPEPVLLVHGTGGNQTDSWQQMAPALKAAGYCVFTFDYGSHNGSGAAGIYGIGEIAPSAAELAQEVDAITAATGARKVDLVGHSQGGMMPRYYLRNLGGKAKVDDLVGLAPSNHGTTNPFAPYAGFLCPACAEQAAGSAFLTALNSGDETPGKVDFTNVVTRNDEVVTPPTSGFLEPDGNDVTNVVLQDKCPNDTREHLGMPYDPPVIEMTLDALGRDGAMDPAFQPSCVTI